MNAIHARIVRGLGYGASVIVGLGITPEFPSTSQPAQDQSYGGGSRRRSRRKRIQPNDPIQTEFFPLVPQYENVIPLVPISTSARIKLQRRREEDILMAA